MANRHIDPRRIKIHYSYTVKDAADALGTHKNTIRLWIKQGLPITDEQRPAMLLGTAIRAFLENRKAKRKHRLMAGERQKPRPEEWPTTSHPQPIWAT